MIFCFYLVHWNLWIIFSYSAFPVNENDTDNDDIDDDDDDEFDSINDDDGIDLRGISNLQPLWVLPLYSLLSSEKQAKVIISNDLKLYWKTRKDKMINLKIW